MLGPVRQFSGARTRHMMADTDDGDIVSPGSDVDCPALRTVREAEMP